MAPQYPKIHQRSFHSAATAWSPRSRGLARRRRLLRGLSAPVAGGDPSPTRLREPPADSANRAALDVARASLSAGGVEVSAFEGLGSIPPMNPDHGDDPGEAVQALRAQIGAADAVLIAAPEYAGDAIAGVVKNGLDWIVGAGDLYGKPNDGKATYQARARRKRRAKAPSPSTSPRKTRAPALTLRGPK
jgi:NADPH-dependent FMN reductase